MFKQSVTINSFKEFFIEKAIHACGITSIIFVILIFAFLAKEGFALFHYVTIKDFLLGEKWYPISDPPRFGIFPLILGSLYVTIGATFISVPIGIASAVYIAEVAPPRTKEILKSGIEILAAIPSVVIGFIGMTPLVPFFKNALNLPTRLTAFSG